MDDFDLKYAVVQLHDVARLIEKKMGVGQLSHELRTLADKLEEVNSENYHAELCGK